MSPRLIESDLCPYCKAEQPDPKPRICGSCGGSLQQRFLRAGCLNSAPVLLALLWGALTWLL